MGVYSWDIDGGFSFPLPVRSPRLTIFWEYPGLCLNPVEITFGLSHVDTASARLVTPTIDSSV